MPALNIIFGTAKPVLLLWEQGHLSSLPWRALRGYCIWVGGCVCVWWGGGEGGSVGREVSTEGVGELVLRNLVCLFIFTFIFFNEIL